MDFRADDFEERNRLALTFNTRHLPLSDGRDNFKGQLADPPQWSSDTRPKSKRKGKVNANTTSGTKKKKQTEEPVDKRVVHKRFDKMTGRYVECIDLS